MKQKLANCVVYMTIYKNSRNMRNTQETHLQNSWNQDFCNRKIKLRSRSLSVVVGSMSASGLSVVRPNVEPFKSKRLWMTYWEQNRFPMMTKRTWSLWSVINNISCVYTKKKVYKHLHITGLDPLLRATRVAPAWIVQFSL